METLIPTAVPFTKMSDGGNDFICLDNMSGLYDPLLNGGGMSMLAKLLCGRGTSVGADGLILACQRRPDGDEDIVARFFEPDGSEVELCGNGTACFTLWAVREDFADGPDVMILTKAGTAFCHLLPGQPTRVKVCLPVPHGLKTDLGIEAEGRHWQLHCLNTGVPHAVIFVDEPDNLDVAHWGKIIRAHPAFAPRGVNVNFVKLLKPGAIRIRTFEFGVEGETLACGTGAAASAILSILRADWPRPRIGEETSVIVHTRGGDSLRVWITWGDGTAVQSVCVESRPRPIYNATFHPEYMNEIRARLKIL